MSCSMIYRCLIWASLFVLACCQVKTPFYANRATEKGVLDNIQMSQYNGPEGNGIDEVDARAILQPIMSPFVTMFDVMQQNAKARAYGDKVQKERDSSPFSNSKGIFDLFDRLQKPTTTPPPPKTFMEQLLQPYLEPWQRQLDTISKEMAGITILPPTTTAAPTTTTQRSLLERSLGMFFPSLTSEGLPPPPPPPAPKEIRRSPASPAHLFDPEVLDKLFDALTPQKRRFRRQLPQLPNMKLPNLAPPVPDFFSPDGFQKLFDGAPQLPQSAPVAAPAPPALSAPSPALPATPAPDFLDLFNPLKPNPILNELNKPVIIGNPFTPNPLMGMFTTKKPLPEFKLPEAPKPQLVDPKTQHIEPQFKLQDPFYNPLFPSRKSKLFDLLAGGEAARLLG